MAEHKYIPCDIYKRGIHVFIGGLDEFSAWFKGYFDEEEEEQYVDETMRWLRKGSTGYASFHYEAQLGHGVILLPTFPTTPAEIAALEHEVMHAVFFLMDFSGVDYTPWSNNEAFTYLGEHLMRNALERLGYEEVKTEKKGENHDTN